MTNEVQTQPSFGQLLAQKKRQIAMALPIGFNIDRMLRVAMTEFQNNKALQSCTPKSIIGCLIQSAQLGLEPDSLLGHAYLIPFKDTCTLIIGYRGMIELARRSGQISTIYARGVRSNDSFEYELGLNENIKHVPCGTGELDYAYAVAKFKDGGYQLEIMTRAEIDAIRKRSKSGSSPYSPWSTDYEEMARKTVIRRLFKYLPVSKEVAQAAAIDEQVDLGIISSESFAKDLEGNDIFEDKTNTEKLLDKIS